MEPDGAQSADTGTTIAWSARDEGFQITCLEASGRESGVRMVMGTVLVMVLVIVGVEIASMCMLMAVLMAMFVAMQVP
jgi:hypothetical protein